jgi:hypothetical protein
LRQLPPAMRKTVFMFKRIVASGAFRGNTDKRRQKCSYVGPDYILGAGVS